MFQHADGELQGLIQAAVIVRECSASELLDLGNTFNKQRVCHSLACEAVGQGRGWDQPECFGGKEIKQYNYPSLR